MTRVKICGVTTPDDALAAVDAGADFVGLNFSTHSIRRVTVVQAKPIVDALVSFSGLTGVYVEQSWQQIAAIGQGLNLTHAQFYSTPWPAERFSTAGLIPAFRVRTAEDVQAVHRLLGSSFRPDMIVIDSFVPGAMGGTGQKAPWELLAGQDFGVPLILAGGLTPENVADAIRLVRPWGVDVASGVERLPGRKDCGKVRAFIQAARVA